MRGRDVQQQHQRAGVTRRVGLSSKLLIYNYDLCGTYLSSVERVAVGIRSN